MNRERSVDPRDPINGEDARETLDWHGKATWGPVPMTALAALMETAPGDQPTRSLEEYAALREVLGEAIDSLPLLEREVFEAVVIERASYRELADRFVCGTTTIYRIKESACAKLRTQLEGEVAEWLK